MAKATVDFSLLNEYEESLRTHGVVVLRDVFTNEHLDKLSDEFDKNWEEVQARLSTHHHHHHLNNDSHSYFQDQ